MQAVGLEELVASAPEDHKDSAEQIFQSVFDALRWTRVVDGTVERIESLSQWKHRQPQDIESDLAYLEIDRAQLLGSLSEYLSQPALASKKGDWLFLNVLTYAEYLATVSHIRKSLMGVERYVESLFPPKTEHSTDVSVLSRRPWHVPATLGVIAMAWVAHPLAGAALTAYSLFASYRRRAVTAKVNSTLTSMLRTYLSFNTIDLSWRHVMAALEESRSEGAVWDASLFALAESRATEFASTTSLPMNR